MKYKITLSYDGTDYGGWQVQPNRKTIQSCLEESLRRFLKKPCSIVGSGRTDAGVHATGQVAHFSCTSNPPTPEELNALLPPAIRIREIDPVDETFHARFSVKRKIYHYHLQLSPCEDPFTHRYRLLAPPLNLPLIEEGLQPLIGTHDFTAFAAAGCGSKDPVKTLYRLEMVPQEGGIRFEFEGNGFLYKMVRNIVGTLLEIGTGKRLPNDILKLLKSKDRAKGGKTAPPHGLFLVKVVY